MSKTYDIPEEVQAVDRMTATIAKLEAEKADLLAALRAIAASDTGKREQRGGATPSRYYVLSEKQVADMTTAITKAENA